MNYEARKPRGVNIPRFILHSSCFILLVLAAQSSRADLSATVYPGYTFSSGERPTTSTLNRLGLPSIIISGTIGGTNSGLAAGSVNGTMLSDGVVDGATIDYTNSSPRALRVKPNSLGLFQLDTTIFGPGLVVGTTNVGLNIDTNIFSINATNSQLTIENLANKVILGTSSILGTDATSTNAMSLAVGNGLVVSGSTISNKMFVSSETSFAASDHGLLAAVPHGLALTPTWTRWVFVCKTNESSYAVGDEVDAAGAVDSGSGGIHLNYGANSTFVFITARNNNNIQLINQSSGAFFTPTTDYWKLKCYARP